MEKRKLLDQVRDRIRFKHYSLRTEETYLQWVRRFVLFHHKRHPRDMGAAEIEAFLTHLLQSGDDIRTVQELLGHQDVSTTMIYIRVLNKGGRGVVSPLDVG